MTRILFTGDILRVGPRGTPNQWGNIGWLQRLLGPSIEIASGCQNIGNISWVHNQSDFDGSMIYSAHGVKPSPYAWAKLFHAEPNELAVEYMREFFEGSLVIAYELSPYLRKAFDRIGCSYIDMCLHPVRFMEDLMMNIASNNGAIIKRVQDYKITEDDFRLRSTFLAGAWRSQGLIRPRTYKASIICLQTTLDRVLIKDGEFTNISGYLTELKKVRSDVERLYIKPHPIERNEFALGFIFDNIDNVEIYSGNFYEMIARNDVDSVYSLSSGTTTEAKYLGVESGHFYRDFYLAEENRAGGSHYCAVMDDYFWPDFWRHILSPYMKVTPKGGYRQAYGKQTLRKTLGQSWDFEKWS